MESFGSDNLSFDLSLFAFYPKTITRNFTVIYGIILGSENSELCTITKTITQVYFKPTNAFNLENIVQFCLVSFQTHRVNKDFSNSVKDYTFQVLNDHFLVWATSDNSEFRSKYFFLSSEYV